MAKMKLFYSPASPYVRKVMVLAHEAGLEKKIETVAVMVTPVKANPDVAKRNPLMKIPALIDGDTTVYDSPVVCEYLDSKHRGKKLFPAKGKARWTALRQQALADGLLDAALLVRYEVTLRPENLRNAEWHAGQMGKIGAAIDQMEKEAGSLKGAPTIGQITFGCALGYLDFRFADYDWRKSHKKLATWFEKFSKRPSMKATVPAMPV